MYGQQLSRLSWDGLSFPEKIGPRHGPGSFFWCLWCVGGMVLHPFCFPPLSFIVVSFLMDRVPGVGTCSISPSLQLLGVVVKAEKHGHVRHKALNVMMPAFPSDISLFSVVLFCF